MPSPNASALGGANIMLHIEYIKNGKAYFMVAKTYADIPKGVQITSVRSV
jgi:hypothetical protein